MNIKVILNAIFVNKCFKENKYANISMKNTNNSYFKNINYYKISNNLVMMKYSCY